MSLDQQVWMRSDEFEILPGAPDTPTPMLFYQSSENLEHWYHIKCISIKSEITGRNEYFEYNAAYHRGQGHPDNILFYISENPDLRKKIYVGIKAAS